MKGLFIPEITASMFRNGCLESIEALMAEGEIYDIDYEPERKKGKWTREVIRSNYDEWTLDFCSECGEQFKNLRARNYCPNCGARMEDEK